MEDKKLKTTVDDFLKESNTSKNDENCTTEECKMKSRSGIIERIEKVYINKDGKQLLSD